MAEYKHRQAVWLWHQGKIESAVVDRPLRPVHLGVYYLRLNRTGVTVMGSQSSMDINRRRLITFVSNSMKRLAESHRLLARNADKSLRYLKKELEK